MTNLQLKIRPMKAQDIQAVVALEQDIGLSSWGAAGYERELIDSEAVLLTAYCGETFLGFLSGRVLGDEFELFSIAVIPQQQRQGIGRNLLEVAMVELQRRGVRHCYLEVRNGNIPAQQLYLSQGFKVIGRRRNYYQNPTDDAVTMKRELIMPKGCVE